MQLKPGRGRMGNIQSLILDAAVHSVSMYGIIGVTSKVICQEANIQDEQIYHYYKNKRELLLNAYIRENSLVFDNIVGLLNKTKNLDISLEEKVRLVFVELIKYMVSNPDRTSFCQKYYHSDYFSDATEYHSNQYQTIENAIDKYFYNIDDCKHTIYALFTMLYDSSYSIIKGNFANNDETIERVYTVMRAIFFHPTEKRKFN